MKSLWMLCCVRDDCVALSASNLIGTLSRENPSF
jgi:hypothetical protein